MASGAGLAQAPASLLRSLWKTGLWKFYPSVLLLAIGLFTLIPIMPTIISDGFASQAAGHPLHCSDYTPDTAPRECHDAHAEAVVWGSWASFISGAVLSFTCAPVIGSLSDQYGRKPFILLGIGLTFGPIFMILLHLWGCLPIQWYFLAHAASGLCSSFSIMLTAVADLMHQSHRAVASGLFIATFSIGIICGPILGAFLAPVEAVYVCLGFVAVNFVYVFAFLPESAPRSSKCLQRHVSGDLAEQDCEGLLPNGRHLSTESADVGAAWKLRWGPECTDGGAAWKLFGSTECTDVEAAWKLHGSTDCAVVGATPVRSDPGKCASKTAAKVGAASKQMTVAEKAGMKGHRNIVHAPPHAFCEETEALILPREDSCREEDIRIELRVEDHRSCKLGPQGGEAEEAAAEQLPPKRSLPRSMLSGWSILYHSAWYRKLALISVIVAVNQTAFQELIFQYLQLTMAFNIRDQATLLVIMSVVSLSVNVVFMALLVKRMGEQWLLVFGLCAFALEQLLFALATTKGLIFGAACLGGFSAVAFPSLLALQSSRVGAQEQGAVSGVMQGLGSLASGTGPLLFAYIFSASTSLDASLLPYRPGTVWYVNAALALVSILLTCTLHWEGNKASAHAADVELSIQQYHHKQAGASPVVGEWEGPADGMMSMAQDAQIRLVKQHSSEQRACAKAADMQPGSGQPESAQPESDQPDSDQPGSDPPGSDQPGSDQPESLHSHHHAGAMTAEVHAESADVQLGVLHHSQQHASATAADLQLESLTVANT